MHTIYMNLKGRYKGAMLEKIFSFLQMLHSTVEYIWREKKTHITLQCNKFEVITIENAAN